MMNGKLVKLVVLAATTLVTSAVVYYQPQPSELNDIPNRIPEAAPYVLAEAQAFPPPYHSHWSKRTVRHNARPATRKSLMSGMGL